MRSKSFFRFLGLLVVATVALASTPVSWIPPTQNTDNSPIPATGAGSLNGSRIEYGTCTGSGTTLAIGTKIGEVVQTTNVATGSIPDLPPGTYCAQVRVKNTYGQESNASPVVSKTFAAPIPKAPTNFSWP